MPFKETVLPDVIARGLVNELCHFPHEDADLGDLDGFNKNTLGLASFILCSSTRRFRSSKSRCSSLSGHARAASAEFLKFGSTGAPQQPVLRMDEMTTYTVQRLTAWPPPYDGHFLFAAGGVDTVAPFPSSPKAVVTSPALPMPRQAHTSRATNHRIPPLSTTRTCLNLPF